MIRSIFFFVIACTLSLYGKAQSQSHNDSLRSLFSRKFSPKELQRDFNILRQALEKGHSGLYRYTSRKSFDSIFAHVEQQLTHPMDLLSFYKLVGPVIAFTREDHTDIEMPAVYNQYYEELALLFPFNCKFLDGRAYIVQNGSDDRTILPGNEILGINDMSMESICRILFTTFASDGFIMTSKYRELDDGGLRSNYFKVFGDVATFDLVVKDDHAVVSKHTVAAKPLSVIRSALSLYEKKEVKPLLYFQMLTDSVALMRVSTFSNRKLRSAQIYYDSFLDSCFRELQKNHIPSLIIDLRENGGGTEGNENLLFSYLADKNFQKYSYAEARTNKLKIRTGVGKPIRHKVFERYERKRDNYRTPEGHYRRRNRGNQSLMAFNQFPNYNRYRGNVYVLISGVTYSGGAEFSSMMYDQHRALFIGEESGGGYYGNTSGYSFYLELPATKLGIDIPLIRFEMNVSGLPDGRGVVPHHLVVPTIQQYLAGRDIEVEVATQLAEKKER